MSHPQPLDETTDSDDLTRLENQLCFALYAATHAITGAYRPMLSAIGLTYTQYLVLLVVWRHEGLSVGEIGSRLKLDTGTLTPLLKRLESADLLVRSRRISDDRVVEIHLTEKGRALYAKAHEIRANIVCQLSMSEHEISQLRGELFKLVERLNVSKKEYTSM